MFFYSSLFYAIIGGILPALIWLWFWLKEDARHPEPKSRIFLAFIAGMMAVVIAYPIEKYWGSFFRDALQSNALTEPFGLIILLALTEEALKFLAAYFIGIKSRFFDEPVDAMVYLITAALGFAAMENFFYLLGIFGESSIYTGLIDAHLRFMGATLLHVVASSAVGTAIAFAYYKDGARKFWYILCGLLTAILLHVLFNLSIIKAHTALDIIIVFSFFWAFAVIVILLFEMIKKINKPQHVQK